MKRNKKISKYSELNINSESIKIILENENWLSISHPQINKRLIIKELRIRPMIKLQQEANKIFREETKWETKQIKLRDTMKKSFGEYVLNLDLQRKNEITKFYKIINSIIKYKTKGKIVKGIKWDEEIILDKKKKQIIIKYYEQIYSSKNVKRVKIENSNYDYRIDVRRAIEQWASNKAAGADYIPGGFYKDKASRKIIIERLEKHFKEYIQTTEIPNYFMEAKLILISKDNKEYPIIEETSQ